MNLRNTLGLSGEAFLASQQLHGEGHLCRWDKPKHTGTELPSLKFVIPLSPFPTSLQILSLSVSVFFFFYPWVCSNYCLTLLFSPFLHSSFFYSTFLLTTSQFPQKPELKSPSHAAAKISLGSQAAEPVSWEVHFQDNWRETGIGNAFPGWISLDLWLALEWIFKSFLRFYKIVIELA